MMLHTLIDVLQKRRRIYDKAATRFLYNKQENLTRRCYFKARQLDRVCALLELAARAGPPVELRIEQLMQAARDLYKANISDAQGYYNSINEALDELQEEIACNATEIYADDDVLDEFDSVQESGLSAVYRQLRGGWQ